MEQNTRPPDFISTFEALTRESYGRVAYTHKTHMKMVDIRTAEQRWITIAQIIISATIAGGAVGALFSKSVYLPVATALLATANLVLTSYLKNVNPGAEAAKHLDTAAQLWTLREELLFLLADCRATGTSEESLQARRNDIQNRLAEIYRGAPATNSKAYASAQNALKNKEDLFFSKDELDKMLPEALRNTKREK